MKPVDKMKLIEEVDLLVIDIVGYANGLMVGKVEDRLLKIFNSKSNSKMNEIHKLLMEKIKDEASR